MTREGSCPCGAVRYAIDGPVRDVIVCHCIACREATGGPWAASAARRQDLTIGDAAPLVWESAAVSEYGARRGRCAACGTTVFWDAPERDTVSFGVETLAESAGLEVAAEIWVGGSGSADPTATGAPRYARGLPSAVSVAWRE